MLSSGKAYSEIGDGWTRLKSLKMNLGVIFNDLLVWIIVFVPEEAKVGTLIRRYGELVEHILHICGDSVRMAAHSVENSSQGVVPIGSLVQMIIDAYVICFGGGVKDYPSLSFLFHHHERNPVGAAVSILAMIWWYWKKAGRGHVNVFGELFYAATEHFWVSFP